MVLLSACGAAGAAVDGGGTGGSTVGGGTGSSGGSTTGGGATGGGMTCEGPYGTITCKPGLTCNSEEPTCYCAANNPLCQPDAGPPGGSSGGGTPCSLDVFPGSLDFGGVPPDGGASATLALTNSGQKDCQVSALALAAGTAPDFSLASDQPFTVAAGAKGTIGVSFVPAEDDGGTALRTGTLTFLTGDPFHPDASVPLAGYVSAACATANRSIFTVDANGTLSRFDPTSLTFTDIGVLDCPGEDADAGAGPFSMAVDRSGTAWVVFDDGNLLAVNTADAGCATTAFDGGGFAPFGMSFRTDPTSGAETLYVSSATTGDLATIALPSLALTTVGREADGWGELAGTGDGQLWEYIPGGVLGGVPVLDRLDPATAAVLAHHPLAGITAVGDFAMAYYGGEFWVFEAPAVYEVDRATLAVRTAIADTGRNVIGVGASSCSP